MILPYYKQNALIVSMIKYADFSRVPVFIRFTYNTSIFMLFFIFFKSI